MAQYLESERRRGEKEKVGSEDRQENGKNLCSGAKIPQSTLSEKKAKGMTADEMELHLRKHFLPY